MSCCFINRFTRYQEELYGKIWPPWWSGNVLVGNMDRPERPLFNPQE